MSLRNIVRALGGDLYDGGRRANIPAPGHSRRDRSVSLLERDGRLIIHTFGDSDWRAVREDLRARGLLPTSPNAPNQKTYDLEVANRKVRDIEADDAGRRHRQAVARALWQDARPIARSLSERHCRRRGIEGPLPGDEALRHHGFTPLLAYRPGLATWPALLAAVRDRDGQITGVEITYLGAGGQIAPGLRLARKTVGLAPPSSAVRLDPADETLLVAEGVFTALSARRRFGLPAWALRSTSNLRQWIPPPIVRSVVIAADRGRDGEASAARLAARLHQMDIAVRLCLPPPPFGDWNDVDLAATRP